MILHKVLKDTRKGLGKTQVQVCRDIDISQTYLSQLESGGKNASTEMMKKLCDYYKIPQAIILWKSTEKKDVPKSKQPLYDKLKPAIDGLVEEFFKKNK